MLKRVNFLEGGTYMVYTFKYKCTRQDIALPECLVTRAHGASSKHRVNSIKKFFMIHVLLMAK